MNQSARPISLAGVIGTLVLAPAFAQAQAAAAPQAPAATPPQQPTATEPSLPNSPTPTAPMTTTGVTPPGVSTSPLAPVQEAAPGAVPSVAPADTTPPPAVVATADATAPAAVISEPTWLKSVNVGVWLRTALRFQNPNEPKKLDDQSLGFYAELHVGGAIYDKVNYTLNFNMQNQANDFPGTVRVLDAIAQLDAFDEFHLWAGHMLVPSDRSNFSGPFFMSPWNYPGVYSVAGNFAFVGPAEGPAGRNTGSTVWGDLGGGLFKYYAGIFNLTDPAASPLFTGRLNFAPIGREPGFYHSSTYYGDKDVLALGVGAQYQRRGSMGPVPLDAAGAPTGPAPLDNFSEVNADLLAEVRLGDSVITGEVAYYHFVGDYNPADDAFYVLGSFLTPKVWVGHLQPMVRYQWAKEKTTDTKMSIVDAHVAYVVKGYALRTLVGFQRTDMDHGIVGNAIQIGAQLMTL